MKPEHVIFDPYFHAPKGYVEGWQKKQNKIPTTKAQGSQRNQYPKIFKGFLCVPSDLCGENVSLVVPIIKNYRLSPIIRRSIRKRLMKSRYSLSAPEMASLVSSSVPSFPRIFISLIFWVS